MRVHSATAVLLIFLLFAPPVAHTAPKSQFPFWACSDGNGSVSLFWLPPLGDWPGGGFRLERVTRRKSVMIADGIRPGWDEAAMAAIPPADAARIRDLDAKIRAGNLTDEDKSVSISQMGRNAAMDPLYGRALGVRYTDSARTSGKRIYRLVARDAGGKTIGTMETGEIDPNRKTGGPDRPARLSASPGENGVALSWPDPPASAIAPVVGYRIDRGSGRRRPVSLTRVPVVPNRIPGQEDPGYLDSEPPQGSLVYEVRSVDIFGRLSKAARAKTAMSKAIAISRPAPAVAATATAIVPPEEVRKEPERQPEQQVPAASPAPAGTVAEPERAAAAAPLSEPPLAQNESYRQRASDSLGGSRSPAEDARGSGGVEAKGPPGSGDGGREPDDGRLRPPRIVSAIGQGDRVTISFEPAAPAERTREILILRSTAPTGLGTVVGHPIPADTRQWDDTTVSAGEYYWYRAVAVDSAGNRSEPSKPRWVAVGSR